jgi:hypothetical protein
MKVKFAPVPTFHTTKVYRTASQFPDQSLLWIIGNDVIAGAILPPHKYKQPSRQY